MPLVHFSFVPSGPTSVHLRPKTEHTKKGTLEETKKKKNNRDKKNTESKLPFTVWNPIWTGIKTRLVSVYEEVEEEVEVEEEEVDVEEKDQKLKEDKNKGGLMEIDW